MSILKYFILQFYGLKNNLSHFRRFWAQTYIIENINFDFFVSEDVETGTVPDPGDTWRNQDVSCSLFENCVGRRSLMWSCWEISSKKKQGRWDWWYSQFKKNLDLSSGKCWKKRNPPQVSTICRVQVSYRCFLWDWFGPSSAFS